MKPGIFESGAHQLDETTANESVKRSDARLTERLETVAVMQGLVKHGRQR